MAFTVAAAAAAAAVQQPSANAQITGTGGANYISPPPPFDHAQPQGSFLSPQANDPRFDSADNHHNRHHNNQLQATEADYQPQVDPQLDILYQQHQQEVQQRRGAMTNERQDEGEGTNGAKSVGTQTPEDWWFNPRRTQRIALPAGKSNILNTNIASLISPSRQVKLT